MRRTSRRVNAEWRLEKMVATFGNLRIYAGVRILEDYIFHRCAEHILYRREGIIKREFWVGEFAPTHLGSLEGMVFLIKLRNSAHLS